MRLACTTWARSTSLSFFAPRLTRSTTPTPQWMVRSAMLRSSLALASVVSIWPCVTSDATMFEYMARRWLEVRPSLRPALRWRIALSSLLERGRARPVVELHPQAEPHLGQDFLDLLQRLAAEVLGLQHLRLGLLHQLADSSSSSTVRHRFSLSFSCSSLTGDSIGSAVSSKLMKMLSCSFRILAANATASSDRKSVV